MKIKWKISTYRNPGNLLLIKKMVDRHKTWSEIIKNTTLACGIPIIIVYYLVGEHLKMTPEIQETIDRLKTYYNCEVEE